MPDMPEWKTPAYCAANYRLLLSSLKDGGASFVPFGADTGRGIRLRHDVDFSLGPAADMAALNRQEGISATFFVLASCPLYNIFSPDGRTALRSIVDASQHVGLHYHHTGGPLGADRLEREFAALRLVVPEAQRVVAWHNPVGDPDELNRQAEKLGFISAYAPPFYGNDRYVSDSNCRHTPGEILDFQRKAAGPLQVLLHPSVWIYGGPDLQTVLKRIFRAKFDSTAKTFADNQAWKDGAGRSILARYNLDD